MYLVVFTQTAETQNIYVHVHLLIDIDYKIPYTGILMIQPEKDSIQIYFCQWNCSH